MRTHELANALMILARALRSAPNVEVGQLDFFKRTDKITTKEGLAVNLSTLAELSRIGRQQWLELIHENGFPVEVRPRDASRDILGKLLKYLEMDPDARERLKRSASKSAAQASPQLMRALASLLETE
jgi:hypothetical protein